MAVQPRRRAHLVAKFAAIAVTATVVTVLTTGMPAAADQTTASTPTSAIVASSGCQTNSIPANDDGSTATAVQLPFQLNFFGTTYNSLWVNNNGNVTFNSPQRTYTPYVLGQNTPPIIAPFFADVDTRAPGSQLVTYGDTTFEGRPAF